MNRPFLLRFRLLQRSNFRLRSWMWRWKKSPSLCKAWPMCKAQLARLAMLGADMFVTTNGESRWENMENPKISWFGTYCSPILVQFLHKHGNFGVYPIFGQTCASKVAQAFGELQSEDSELMRCLWCWTLQLSIYIYTSSILIIVDWSALFCTNISLSLSLSHHYILYAQYINHIDGLIK